MAEDRMAEPRVVVAHREDLRWLLAEACQLEHMIMCQYLYAEFSLKSEGLTAERCDAARASDQMPEVVHEAGDHVRSHAAKRGAHVPPELQAAR